MIDIHYFASIREALGRDSERLALPESVQTVAALVDHLISIHGEAWELNLKANSVLVAINQHIGKLSSAVSDGDEVAFFPPVTGG